MYLYVLTMAPGVQAKIYSKSAGVFIKYLLSLGFLPEDVFSSERQDLSARKTPPSAPTGEKIQ